MNANLLVLTDFSEGSINALHYALNMAHQLEMKIILMNICKKMEDFLMASKKMEETVRLSKVKQPDVTIISNVEAFPSENNINEFIAREGIGAIVIGTEGESGLKPVVMGSFANTIISLATCPVIAVPLEGKFKGIRNILVLSQFDLKEVESIRYLFRIAKEFNSKVTFFNVGSDKEVQESQSATFKKGLNELVGNVSFDIVIDNSFDIVDSVERYVENSQPDMVATLGKDQVSFENLYGKRLTKMLSLQTIVPILSLPNTNVSDISQNNSKSGGKYKH